MRRPTRILVPIDPSKWAASAVDWAVQFAERSAAQVELLYVCDEDRDDVLLPLESASAGVTVRSRRVFGDLVHATVLVANEEHFDLVVLAGAEGAVAEGVARGSLCPVVTVCGTMIDSSQPC